MPVGYVEPKIMREIRAIREKHYNETKHMTSKEYVCFVHEKVKRMGVSDFFGVKTPEIRGEAEGNAGKSAERYVIDIRLSDGTRSSLWFAYHPWATTAILKGIYGTIQCGKNNFKGLADWVPNCELISPEKENGVPIGDNLY